MPESDLERFLEPLSPEIRALVRQARELILECIPEALEMVDPPSGIVAYGFSPQYRDLIFALAPFKNHLNLMFARGADLPDPADLLSGTGKRARHVRIERSEDLQRPELRSLILAALEKR